MSTTLPVADRPPVRRYAGRAGAPPPAAALGRARAARARRAGRRWRAAAARRPGRVGRARHHRRGTSTGSCWSSPVFLVVQTRAHPLRPLLVARCSASRCWPSCARTSSSNTLALPVGVVESAGHRRPAHPDLARRRAARLVGALGAARSGSIALVTAVLTIAAALLVGWWVALPCLLGVPPLVVGAALVPRAAPRTATCARARRTPPSTPRSPRPSRAPGRSRRSGSATQRIERIDARHRRVVRRGALHPVPAHGVLPDRGDRLPDPDRAPRCCSAAGSTRRARCRSATSPRRRSTCRC